MDITDEMLQAAVRKATEAGIFRRNCNPVEWTINMQIMQTILQAALDARNGETDKPVVLPRLLMKDHPSHIRKRR